MTVTLAPGDVPTEVRGPLETVLAINATGTDLRRRIDVAHPDSRPELQQQIDDNDATGREAFAVLAEATRDAAPAMRAFAENKFAATIERLRSELRTAEASLREAAALAALAVSVRNGKTNLNPDDSPAAESCEARRACARLAAELRGMELPDLG